MTWRRGDKKQYCYKCSLDFMRSECTKIGGNWYCPFCARLERNDRLRKQRRNVMGITRADN